jgi:hypothetical protein
MTQDTKRYEFVMQLRGAAWGETANATSFQDGFIIVAGGSGSDA